MIDVQSAAQTRAVTPEMIKSVPIGGTMYQLAAMMPGVTIVGGAAVVDVGGASGSPVQAQLSSHGSATGDEVQLLDGLRIGNMMGGSRTNITLAPLLYEQVDVQISGQGGDSTTIGVTSNAIPRSGGNTFAGTFLTNGANSSHAERQPDAAAEGHGPGRDVEPEERVRHQRRRSAGRLSGTGCGSTSTGRYQTNTSYIAGLFFPVDPKAFIRVEDRSNQAFDDQFVWDIASRFTAVAHAEAARQRLLRRPAQVVAALDDLGAVLAGSGRHGRLAAAPLSGHASPTPRRTGC